jgi:hypothetical protein
MSEVWLRRKWGEVGYVKHDSRKVPYSYRRVGQHLIVCRFRQRAKLVPQSPLIDKSDDCVCVRHGSGS